jgi:hypothetical protein
MNRVAKLVASITDPITGWDARLWWRWALYSALAYTVVLAVVGLTSLGLDATRIAVDHRAAGTLVIATVGALLYGGVLGASQWRVLRERLPIPCRAWVLASVIPALITWIAVVVPAGIAADSSNRDLRVAYFLAVSQALALGPLIGFAQASALRPYTRSWKWWIPANLVSWLVVEAVFYLASLIAGAFGFAHGGGSPLEAYLVLIVAAPISGRWLLWVTAPGATR